MFGCFDSRLLVKLLKGSLITVPELLPVTIGRWRHGLNLCNEQTIATYRLSYLSKHISHLFKPATMAVNTTARQLAKCSNALKFGSQAVLPLTTRRTYASSPARSVSALPPMSKRPGVARLVSPTQQSLSSRRSLFIQTENTPNVDVS